MFESEHGSPPAVLDVLAVLEQVGCSVLPDDAALPSHTQRRQNVIASHHNRPDVGAEQ